LGRFTLYLFRRHVLRRSEERSLGGQLGGGVEDSGNTEVGEHRAPPSQQNVPRLEVTVHDAGRVRVRERVGQVGAERLWTEIWDIDGSQNVIGLPAQWQSTLDGWRKTKKGTRLVRLYHSEDTFGDCVGGYNALFSTGLAATPGGNQLPLSGRGGQRGRGDGKLPPGSSAERRRLAGRLPPAILGEAPAPRHSAVRLRPRGLVPRRPLTPGRKAEGRHWSQPQGGGVRPHRPPPVAGQDRRRS
jgi:hypothetical protein